MIDDPKISEMLTNIFQNKTIMKYTQKSIQSSILMQLYAFLYVHGLLLHSLKKVTLKHLKDVMSFLENLILFNENWIFYF